MSDLYTLPDNVRLDTNDVRLALEAVEVTTKSYVANAALNHVFLDQRNGLKLFVVEGLTSKRLTEVVGDTVLWSKVRAVAVAAARITRPSTPETDFALGETTQLGLAA